MIPRQYRIHVVLMIAAALMIILPLLNEKPDAEKAAVATAAADEFLQLVDAGHYDASWQVSAKLLQEKVSKEKWVEQMQQIRGDLGPLVSRKQDDISYATAAKDSPDGEYIQIFYNTDFKNKPGVKETITVMLEKSDGHWRVAGYFIK